MYRKYTQYKIRNSSITSLIFISLLFKACSVLNFFSKHFFNYHVNPIQVHNHQKAQKEEEESSDPLPLPVVPIVDGNEDLAKNINSGIKKDNKEENSHEDEYFFLHVNINNNSSEVDDDVSSVVKEKNNAADIRVVADEAE